jgi:hypothetical protein
MSTTIPTATTDISLIAQRHPLLRHRQRREPHLGVDRVGVCGGQQDAAQALGGEVVTNGCGQGRTQTLERWQSGRPQTSTKTVSEAGRDHPQVPQRR